MFKHKSSHIVMAILLGFVAIIVMVVYQSSKKELQTNGKLITNNIAFSGVITNLNVSENHAFGILQLKILETNNNSYNFKAQNYIFPYQIKDSIAEIYTHISTLEIKKGYRAVVNSNNKTITVFDGAKLLYEWDIYIVKDETDINFVKENTIFE